MIYVSLPDISSLYPFQFNFFEQTPWDFTVHRNVIIQSSQVREAQTGTATGGGSYFCLRKKPWQYDHMGMSENGV